jgi:Flp pilus assembly pilin Flp
MSGPASMEYALVAIGISVTIVGILILISP